MKIDESTRKRIVYAILVLAIIYGAVNLGPRKRPIGVPEASLPTIEPAIPAAAEAPLALAHDSSSSEWGRDPFVYGASIEASGEQLEEEKSSDLNLTAIAEANGTIMAVINGHPVGRGDIFDGWIVVEISKTSATVQSGGRELVLHLGQ